MDFSIYFTDYEMAAGAATHTLSTFNILYCEFKNKTLYICSYLCKPFTDIRFLSDRLCIKFAIRSIINIPSHFTFIPTPSLFKVVMFKY